MLVCKITNNVNISIMKRIFLSLIVILSTILTYAETRKEYFALSLVSVDVNSNSVDSTSITNEVINGFSVNNYTDGVMSISFMPQLTHFDFVIKNNTDKTIKIIWDESMFYKGNVSDKVFHSGVVIKDRMNPQSPSSILKGMELSDIIIPCSNVSFNSYFGRWVYNFMLFQEKDNGEMLKILLPISINDETVEYVFTFKAEYHKARVKYRISGDGLCYYVKLK